MDWSANVKPAGGLYHVLLTETRFVETNACQSMVFIVVSCGDRVKFHNSRLVVFI